MVNEYELERMWNESVAEYSLLHYPDTRLTGLRKRAGNSVSISALRTKV